MELSSTIRELVSNTSTALTIYMPTHTFGNETTSDANKFNSLINNAAKKLADAGLPQTEVDSVLAPVRGLTASNDFWQHRTQGLAIFSSAQHCVHFSLPYSVPEQVVVSNHFHLRHIVPFLTDNATFFILQLSQNTVKLFEADAHSISAITHDDIPPSIEIALQHEDPERQLQMRSVGSGNLAFHGHGAGEELDKATLERFLRAVDKGVSAALNGHSEPLVLAAVPYYLPMYQSVSKYQHVHNELITGSPERTSEEDLRKEGWSLISSTMVEKKQKAVENLRAVVGTGRTTSTLAEIVDAAQTGRIETLFIDANDSLSDQDEDALNAAITRTFSHGGAVMITPEVVDAENSAIALLRY
jgi:hypothetical protein